MKSWRIHVSWAIVTVIVALVWGRITASRTEEKPALRSAAVTENVRSEPAEPVAATPTPAPSIPVAAAASPNAPTASSDPLTPEQIRSMLREKLTWAKAFDALKVLPDRALMLKLLEECFALGAVEIRIPISAFMQLGEMGGPDAAEIVERALRAAEDERTRYRAARALAQIQEPRSLSVLLETYQLDPLDLKVLCAAALQKLGHPGPASEMLSRLTRSLDDPDGGIRREALEYISALKTPAALPVLTRCLNDSNGDVRCEAISGLESLAIPEVLPLLERATQDSNSNVADDARRALERLKKAREKADKP